MRGELAGFRWLWAACSVASGDKSLLGCGVSPFSYLGHRGPYGWTRAREDGGLWRVLGAFFEVSGALNRRPGQTGKPSIKPVWGDGILGPRSAVRCARLTAHAQRRAL